MRQADDERTDQSAPVPAMLTVGNAPREVRTFDAVADDAIFASAL